MVYGQGLVFSLPLPPESAKDWETSHFWAKDLLTRIGCEVFGSKDMIRVKDIPPDGWQATSWDAIQFGCGFFAHNWKLPAYNGAFLLTVDNFSFFAYSWSFFAYSFSSFTYSWSFFAYNGKVCLIRTFRDCKQRSLTVSKKAPTVSKKASPQSNDLAFCSDMYGLVFPREIASYQSEALCLSELLLLFACDLGLRCKWPKSPPQWLRCGHLRPGSLVS